MLFFCIICFVCYFVIILAWHITCVVNHASYACTNPICTGGALNQHTPIYHCPPLPKKLSYVTVVHGLLIYLYFGYSRKKIFCKNNAALLFGDICRTGCWLSIICKNCHCDRGLLLRLKWCNLGLVQYAMIKTIK